MYLKKIQRNILIKMYVYRVHSHKMNNISASNSSALASAFISSAVPFTIHHISSTPPDQIFLQTKLAKGIAGVFVWIALFLTCQQVYILSIMSFQ